MNIYRYQAVKQKEQQTKEKNYFQIVVVVNVVFIKSIIGRNNHLLDAWEMWDEKIAPVIGRKNMNVHSWS